MLRSVSSNLSTRASKLLHPCRSHYLAIRTLQTPSKLNYGLIRMQQLLFTRAIHLSGAKQRSSQQSSTEDIDRSLHRLDTDIRRTGRVARQEIDEILQDIRDMKKATSSQSLMIIRCCGELVPGETPVNRTKLVQEVWKTMESLNVPMDISHYNALLRVYLENEHKFNPSEFLQELNTKGIEPNRVTYQRLISRFCQEGDIDGASTILQHMKEKQLPINEHVFNALINGHACADDMESAEGIISVMKQAGLEPNDDTFVTLMCGYARKGNIENIKKIIKGCEEKEINLIGRDYLSVIYTLASQGHDSLVEEIIPFLRKHVGFNQDVTNLILRLVSIGKPDVGYRLLKEMTPITRSNEAVPSGNFFIVQLIKSDFPNENVIKYCHMLSQEGLNKYALAKACEHSLISKQFDKAFDFLEALKESGAPLRQHFFWPFFASSQSEKDIYDGLKCMKFLEMSPTNETLRDYIIPCLLTHSDNVSPENTLEKLSSYTGIQLSTIVPAAIQHLLNENDFQTVSRFASKYRIQFGNPQLRRGVVDAYIKNNDAKSFVQIIGNSGVDGEDRGREIVGMMLMELLESVRPKDKSRLLLPVLNEFLACGLGLSNSGSELIQNNLGEELTPEVANLILQLTSGDLVPKIDHYQRQPKTTSTQFAQTLEERSPVELEQLLETAIKSNKPTKSLKKALLFSYCRHKNLEKAQAIKQDLDSQGFVYAGGLQALLLELYSHHNMLEEAQNMYSGLINSVEHPFDDMKILKYANLLIMNEKYDECVKVLQDTPRDESRKPLGAIQQALVWKILNKLAENGEVEKVQAVFKILKERNLTTINNVVLGPLVKAYLVRDDMEGALKEFERCVQEYNSTPWKQELFCRFIKAEDTDRLQKVMDLSTNLHGEVNSMYDLVFAFIQCGKVRQAKKILETPGLRVRNDKIEYTCQKYLEEDRTSELENLIQVTKDLVDIDRNSMYFYLLKLYCKNGDSDKALSVWTSLQEENVQASPDLLIFLANFLQQNNLPVPFIVPEKTQTRQTFSKSETDRSPVGPAITEFRKSIEQNEIDKALQIKQRLDGDVSQGKLNLNDLTNLIEKMARAERLGEATKLTEEMLDKGLHPYPRTLRFLLGRLAAAAEVDTLNRFENKLTPDLKRKAMYNTRLCVAYTNADRGREYFETFVKKNVEKYISGSQSIKDSETYLPLSGATYILLRNEDLLKDFEELALKAEQKGDISLYNCIWSYYLVKKNFEKAKEIWETKLKKQSRVLFRSVLIEARVKKEEDVARELANFITSSEILSNATKGAAFSCVVDIMVSNEKPENGLKYLQEKLQLIKLEDFTTSTLVRLKEKLEASNQKFPYEITRKDTRGRKTVVSESDSDSD